jgi:hypothetical protein
LAGRILALVAFVLTLVTALGVLPVSPPALAFATSTAATPWRDHSIRRFLFKSWLFMIIIHSMTDSKNDSTLPKLIIF